jgi:hypothetical protein
MKVGFKLKKANLGLPYAAPTSGSGETILQPWHTVHSLNLNLWRQRHLKNKFTAIANTAHHGGPQSHCMLLHYVN